MKRKSASSAPSWAPNLTETVAVVLTVQAVTMAVASTPSGVTPTLLARGTYDAFKVKSHPHGNGLFKAQAKRPIDVVVRRHEYQAGGSTGWHAHPYPVFITVTSGEVTFYEYDDPSCTGTVVKAGQGYVDSGHGHIGRNESGQPAVDVSVMHGTSRGPVPDRARCSRSVLRVLIGRHPRSHHRPPSP